MLETKAKVKHPEINPGDRVKVSVKTREGDKERTQVFSGIVIRVRKGANRANFTVRHVAYGVGVERTFFVNSPFVEKVEIASHGDVRRARLFYLRGLSSRASRAKLKSKARVMSPDLVSELVSQEHAGRGADRGRRAGRGYACSEGVACPGW